MFHFFLFLFCFCFCFFVYNRLFVLLYSIKYSYLNYTLVGWLIVWILWHINLCRLFYAKFIFIQIINSIQTIQFSVSTVSTSKTALFQVIQFSIRTHFNSIRPIGPYLSRPEWTKERKQWRGAPLSPKLQHYWNLTIRLFSVISRTLVGGVGWSGGSYASTEKQLVYSTTPTDWAIYTSVWSQVTVPIYIHLLAHSYMVSSIPIKHQ